ncbi:MAG TPA: hypothetical protein VGA66_19300 [Mycobacterium sp.]|jgi:hypothetical protein
MDARQSPRVHHGAVEAMGVERFTDVFELQNGQRLPLSAPETAT